MLHESQQENLGVPSQNEEITRVSSVKKPKIIHAVLTSRGGVGKSFIASMITQYLVESGYPIVAFDVDPMQATLSNTRGLPAESVELIGTDDRVNVAVMDACFTRMIDSDSNFVIDSGASGFVAFMSYLLKDQIFEVLIDEGKRVIIHAVIVGADRLLETTVGLNDLLTQFPPSVDFVLWQNPFFGPLKTDDGRPFDETPWWLANKGRFSGVVRIPEADQSYTGAAVRDVLSGGLTFAEALASQSFDKITKIRLRRFWGDMKSQIWATI